MAASGAFPAAPGCPAGVFGAIGVSNKYRNECCAKEGALTSQPSQSPRASSAWSTQDGFVACADPDRETSLEVRPWGSHSLPASLHAPSCPAVCLSCNRLGRLGAPGAGPCPDHAATAANMTQQPGPCASDAPCAPCCPVMAGHCPPQHGLAHCPTGPAGPGLRYNVHQPQQ